MRKKIFITLSGIIVISIAFVMYAKQTSSTVVVERVFEAPVEKVWQVWTDTESMKKWWSPKYYTAPTIQNDFREGGKFLLSMQSPDGKISWNTGTYTQIITNQKIVSKMSFSDETGKAIPASEAGVPGKWPDEIEVIVQFEDLSGKTKIQITEVGIPLLMSFFAKLGWQQQFDKMEPLLK